MPIKFRATTITFNQDGILFEVTVSRANGLIGMEHAEALASLIESVEAGKLEKKYETLGYMRAACVPATIEHTGFNSWPPTIEEFAELPEQFIDSWYAAVREINPHWWAAPDASYDDTVKKVTASTPS